MRRRSSSSDEAAIAGIALLVIIAVVILAWLAIQAAALVIKNLVAHPHNRPLQLAAGVALVATLAALAGSFHIAALNALDILAAAFLVTTAWAVDTYYDGILKQPVTQETLVQNVLKSPWW